MRDTSIKMERHFRKLIMEKPGADRLEMGCSMFDTSKSLIRAFFKNKGLPLTGPEYRKNLFLRIYGSDFDAETREKILMHLEGCSS